ncbi:MAG: bifunctional 4-hydroxy-2-oxoglutarate aldolase/2-dehydro-3-deoxy-phosphogluconate aldolase [Anaerobacillus sp.]
MTNKSKDLLSSRIVAVVRKIAPDKVKPLIQALIDGGITGIEITMDSENATTMIRELKNIHKEKALIGAGTVLNIEQAKEAIDAGADFIVAPILDRETIEFTKSQGIIMVPGAFTPTEIYQAHKWGADMVKVFPASALGPNFIKDVRGPLSEISLMSTGGVSLQNIESLFEAGASAVGVGGSLLDKALIQNEDWEGIRDLSESYVNKITVSP